MKQYKHNGGTFQAEELKPCPFCGGEAELKFAGNDFSKSRKATIKCKGCRVQIVNGAIRNSSEWLCQITIQAWNARVPKIKKEVI